MARRSVSIKIIPCKSGQQVRIQDEVGDTIPRTFTVSEKKKNVIIITDDDTNETRRVHKTRIVENLNTGDSKYSVSEELGMKGITTMAKQEKAEEKAEEKAGKKAGKKVAKKSVKKEAAGAVAVAETTKKEPKGIELNINALKNEGEVYHKTLPSFDWEHVKAEAYVVIAKDGNSFRTFNVYNNRVTEKGQRGVQYNLKDANKKRTQLLKKGYELVD